ncbi:ribonuclease G [Sporomusaceae bacterium BoRhaA]|uniref:Rne/Rng family ribonuclease n=1 Tax=Pelorhabdus rhamnosifermentans TaxID=2772457 RepID=UPI001C062200|nr:Rne/Rng family ribonuclease [Pelorhabdus rhamnosifermentans]MBU2699791.1 ribonuclease G [Pelorhabdus rhamnosifermentans]
MTKQIVVNVVPEETRMALVEDGDMMEAAVERTAAGHLVGNIYKGKVKNVLPGMQAAFIDIGRDRNAFLYIDDVIHLTVGQDMMIQILKDEIGTKGPRATTRLSLPGRYVVLMPTSTYVGISRRIENPVERERLKNLAEELKPADMGVIVRTVAENQSEEVLAKDILYLVNLWHSITVRAKISKSPTLLYCDADLVIRLVRDLLAADTDEFIVDQPLAYDRVVELVKFTSPDLVDRVKLYDRAEDIFAFYGLEQELDKIGQRNIVLKSGGYIVIDKTEALTVIDVNTGKFVGKTSLADTVLTTNLEAAEEIARQLRLRDIGGIIIIDFIDMDRPSDQQAVLLALEGYLKKDRTKTNVLGLTALGLVEMTRKKARQNLEMTLYADCPCCHGCGRIQSPETVTIQVHRALRKLAGETKLSHTLRVQVHPTVAEILGEKASLAQLEKYLAREIIIEAVSTMDFEAFSILHEKD